MTSQEETQVIIVAGQDVLFNRRKTIKRRNDSDILSRPGPELSWIETNEANKACIILHCGEVTIRYLQLHIKVPTSFNGNTVDRVCNYCYSG